MSAHQAHRNSLRPDRRERSLLVRAFAISLVVHLLAWGGYSGGKKLGWWEYLRLPAWMKRLTQVVPEFATDEESVAEQNQTPLIFVEVSPSRATSEAPENPRYYSDKNSLAANPEPNDLPDPEIKGTQDKVPKTDDVERDFNQLMPDFRPEPPPEPAEEARLSPGDLTMGKPDLRPMAEKTERDRPRTLEEARARKGDLMPGRKMRQPGGVNRVRLEASLDTVATPFGSYDAKFISIVQSRWYNLLDAMSYSGYQQGKVVVEFQLNYDGRITDMKVLDNTVTESLSLMCQKAVIDPAPFDKWPRDMRLLVGKEFRKITFTFYYN